jgi:hypothetical protein
VYKITPFIILGLNRGIGVSEANGIGGVPRTYET